MAGVKAVILMAGQGERFKNALPKQFHLLKEKKVYLWTLEKFILSNLFDEIILVAPQNKIKEIEQEVRQNIQVIPGGDTRQESSHLGLIACGLSTEIVVIHDGVRPFVTQRILEENITAARRFKAVNTCIPSADTLVHAPEKKKIRSIPPRTEYLRGQTPQSFSYPLILEAHKKTKLKNATDDCSLILEMEGEIAIVKGEEKNIKITTPLDLLIAEQIVSEQKGVYT